MTIKKLLTLRIIKGKNYWKTNNDNDMKFNAIVGNPPYSELISNDSGNSSLSKQLFPYFIEIGIKIKPNYLTLVTPSRWFTGDAQDKSFLKLRDFIKNNNNFSKIFNYSNSNDVFNGVVIKGGINYFLIENKYQDKVYFTNFDNNIKTTEKRNLFEDDLDIIISNSKDYSLLQKINNENFISLTTITKGRNAFGIIGKISFLNKIAKNESFQNSFQLRCKANEIKYIEKLSVVKGIDVFEKYKVFISKSAGDPNKDFKVIGESYIGKPFEACTDSLIPIGKFDTLEEATNLQKYLKTKFLRYLVSILKISQNVTQIVYKFVPLQDFTENSDIDWSKSIADIDQQLYAKYGLSEEEIAFIESMIKPMDVK